MSNLIVVLDPDYGHRLDTVAQIAPVWAVDTQVNKEAVERLWKTRTHADHREKGAITSYRTQNPADRLNSLLGIIPELETHHGKVEDNELIFPDGFVLGVIGLTMNDAATSALQELGFKSFNKTRDGFEARK